MWWIVAVSVLLLLGVYLLLTPPQDDDDFDEEPLPSAPLPAVVPPVKKASEAGAGASVAKAGPQSFPAGPITIYFGSQTGTAEGFAKTLATEANTHGFDAKVEDLEDFEFEDMAQQKLALFVVATYGEGEPTDNAVRFLRAIKNKDGDIEEDALASLSYSTFGLGNRQYEHFNKMGRDVHKFIGKMGGEEAFAYGEGDDDAMLEDDFDAWREGLWPALVAKFHPDGEAKAAEMRTGGAGGGAGGAKGGGDGGSLATVAPKLYHPVSMLPSGSPRARLPARKPRPGQSQASVTGAVAFFISAPATMTVNRELRRSTDGGSTRHVELDISACEALHYETADNLAVLPENPSDAVERTAEALGLNLDDWFEFRGDSSDSEKGAPFPTPCTVRDALTKYCDLLGMPRKGVLSQLAHFAGADADKRRLLFLASKDGRGEYNTWVSEAGRSLYELLLEFPSLGAGRLPLEYFLEICPRLQPRYYTISSSSHAHPSSVHVTVSVLREPRPGGREVRGVCSTYLAREDLVGQAVQVFVRASSFRLPKSPSTPVIMIGPGTGIAPMRAFLQDRDASRIECECKGEDGGYADTVLFFGCRHKDADFIYEDELLSWARSGTLTALETAFSRDTAQKVYVQDLLRQKADMVKGLINAGAHVYVCGGTTMGADVMGVVSNLLGSEAKTKELQNEGRYVQELWS